MYLKVRPKNISLKLGICPKLVAWFCGPFEILDRIGLVAYKLEYPSYLRVQNVFYVSLLEKYVHDPNQIIDWNLIQVEPKGDIMV